MPASPPVSYARSVSLTLPSTQRVQPLRVLSVHRRVLNLEDAAGRILAVVAPEIGDGPFHIVLDRIVSLDFVRPGERAWRRGDALTLGSWRVDWSQARRWDPMLRPDRIPPRSWAALTDCAHSSESFRDRWQSMDKAAIARLQRGARLIAEGVAGENLEALKDGVSLLVGLGPGLTPAGDDYLLGALARLHLDASLPDGEMLGRFVSARADATTRLSRAWLLHAAQGRFDARWHTLQKALATGEKEGICRATRAILSVGATSGPQAMAGFLLT